MSFCGECGAQVEDGARFCSECGKPVEAAAAEPTPSQLPMATVPTETARSSRMPLLVGIALGVVALAVVGLFAAKTLAPKTPTASASGNGTSSEQTEQDDASLELAAGLKAFNAAMTTKQYNNLQRIGDVYVSVGWAADYPDQMLVTLTQPRLSGDGSAWQYMFSPSSVGRLYPTTLDAAFLGDSVQQWNAHLDDAGNVLLDGYETESAP